MQSHNSSVGRCCCAFIHQDDSHFYSARASPFTLYHHVSHLISRTHFPAQAVILLKFESPFLSMSSSTSSRLQNEKRMTIRSFFFIISILISFFFSFFLFFRLFFIYFILFYCPCRCIFPLTRLLFHRNSYIYGGCWICS